MHVLTIRVLVMNISSNKEGLEQSLAKMMILFVHVNLATTEQVHGTVEGGQRLTLA